MGIGQAVSADYEVAKTAGILSPYLKEKVLQSGNFESGDTEEHHIPGSKWDIMDEQDRELTLRRKARRADAAGDYVPAKGDDHYVQVDFAHDAENISYESGDSLAVVVKSRGDGDRSKSKYSGQDTKQQSWRQLRATKVKTRMTIEVRLSVPVETSVLEGAQDEEDDPKDLKIYTETLADEKGELKIGHIADMLQSISNRTFEEHAALILYSKARLPWLGMSCGGRISHEMAEEFRMTAWMYTAWMKLEFATGLKALERKIATDRHSEYWPATAEVEKRVNRRCHLMRRYLEEKFAINHGAAEAFMLFQPSEYQILQSKSIWRAAIINFKLGKLSNIEAAADVPRIDFSKVRISEKKPFIIRGKAMKAPSMASDSGRGVTQGEKVPASPTPVGDDLADYKLAQERFEASCRSINTTATPEGFQTTPGSASTKPKRRIRASLEGRISTPIKLSRTPARKPSAVIQRVARRSLSMPQEVFMKKPSIWSDVGIMLLLIGLLAGLIWVIYVGVDWFWEG